MGLQRDSLEPFISQKTEIDGRGGDQETLVGTDVRSRLTPPNMLLLWPAGSGRILAVLSDPTFDQLFCPAFAERKLCGST
jgi:hypothetical protein